ncbi:hypothetical protein GCM10022214_40520 [Actinomadura miaoliensis]|uniref:Uncharacterized protein n=1 Tax=Actinomadura miaoliensis TaxID=430685 RepID=A0ABP7W136_9ACTN
MSHSFRTVDLISRSSSVSSPSTANSASGWIGVFVTASHFTTDWILDPVLIVRSSLASVPRVDTLNLVDGAMGSGARFTRTANDCPGTPA